MLEAARRGEEHPLVWLARWRLARGGNDTMLVREVRWMDQALATHVLYLRVAGALNVSTRRVALAEMLHAGQISQQDYETVLGWIREGFI